jgi:hypothetical protein
MRACTFTVTIWGAKPSTDGSGWVEGFVVGVAAMAMPVLGRQAAIAAIRVARWKDFNRLSFCLICVVRKRLIAS